MKTKSSCPVDHYLKFRRTCLASEPPGHATCPALKPRQAAEPPQSPGSLLYVLYVLYLIRQAAESPLFPSSLLYVLYVLYILYARKSVVYVLYRAI